MSSKPKSNKSSAKEPQKKEEPKSSCSQKGACSLCIGRRCFDNFFVLAYLAFFATVVVAVLMTHCEEVVPKQVGSFAVASHLCSTVDKVEHLFGHALDHYKEWTKLFSTKLDASMTLVHQVNVFFTAPIAILLALGFLKGSQWAKNLGLVHAAVMLYGMAVVDLNVCKILHANTDALVGTVPACRVACIVYGFWTFFPLAVMARLWREKPFEQTPCCPFFSCIMKLVCVGWGIAAAVMVYEFGVKKVDNWKNFPSVLDHTSVVWDQTAPHREHATKLAGEATQAALTTVKDLGQKVLDLAQNFNKPAETK